MSRSKVRPASTWSRCCCMSCTAWSASPPARAVTISACSSWECSAAVLDWYISVISAQREISSPSSWASTSLPMSSAMRTWKSPSSSVRWPTSLPSMAFFSAATCCRSARILAGVLWAMKARTISASSMRRTAKTWRASSTEGVATKAPRAGSSRIRRFCDSWNSAWRTRVRETPKWSANFCSASLVPGRRRCSTMARVRLSTMKLVVEVSIQPS